MRHAFNRNRNPVSRHAWQAFDDSHWPHLDASSSRAAIRVWPLQAQSAFCRASLAPLLNPLIPSRAECHPVAPLHEAAGQLIKPGLVLAPYAGQGHASAAAGGAERIPHAFLAKPLASCGHEPVQFIGHTCIGAALAPCGGYQLLAPPLLGVIALLSRGRNGLLVSRAAQDERARATRKCAALLERRRCRLTSRAAMLGFDPWTGRDE